MQDIFIRLEDCCLSPEGKDLIGRVSKNKSRVSKSLKEEFEPWKNTKFSLRTPLDKPSYADVYYMGGCTACAALIVDNVVYIANCGDSRAIIVEKEKSKTPRVILTTIDHKPENRDEKKRIEAANG